MDVTGKFDPRIIRTLRLHGIDIARGLGMVTSSNHKIRVGQLRGDDLEGLDHQFEPLVSSPFSKGQDAMIRLAALGEIRILRPLRQDSVRADVNVVTAIFFAEDLAIPRHQNRDRVSEQKNLGSYHSRSLIDPRMSNADVF